MISIRIGKTKLKSVLIILSDQSQSSFLKMDFMFSKNYSQKEYSLIQLNFLRTKLTLN